MLIPGHPNELGPGKRPRVTLSPTLVTTADGKALAVLSTPGGDTQEQGLLQVLFDSIRFRMNAQNAMEAPRLTRAIWFRVSITTLGTAATSYLTNASPADAADRWPRAQSQHDVALQQRRRARYDPDLDGGAIEAGADPYYYRSAHAW